MLDSTHPTSLQTPVSVAAPAILKNHPAKLIWITGLSGAGKSTVATALSNALREKGHRTCVLDGDHLRQGLNSDLGYTNQDRAENIRRIAEVAKIVCDAGVITISACISPFRAERDFARRLIGERNFVEVYLDTPLTTCESRDPKGLYKKARNGEIPNFTGIGSPYEIPEIPHLKVGSHGETVEQIVKLTLNHL